MNDYRDDLIATASREMERLTNENTLLKRHVDRLRGLLHLGRQLRHNLRGQLNAAYFRKRDADRYAWLRQNPAFETEAYLGSLRPEEYDLVVDDRMGIDLSIEARFDRG